MSAPAPATPDVAPVPASIPASTPAPAPGPPTDSGMSTPSLLTHRAIRAVVAALSAAGVPDAAALIRIMPETAPTAAAAAAQLGCPVGAIANSLVFDVAGEPLLVLTSGAHRVDPKALGPRIGLSRSAIKRAKPDDVKKATGQAIGGVAPVGHLQKIRTLVDEELRQYDVVWAAGGHHMAVYPSDFETLVRVTDGEVVKVD